MIRSLLVGVPFSDVLSDVNAKRNTRKSSHDHEAEEKVPPSFTEIIQFLASSRTLVKPPSTTQPANFRMVESISVIAFRITQEISELGIIHSL
jgi:hypothetical protein